MNDWFPAFYLKMCPRPFAFFFSFRHPEIWAAIPQCQNIIITECDLSSTISDYLASYKVAIRVNTLKNHSPYAFLEFTPYIEAQVGPPGVWFESIYGDVKINILHPEADQQKMWKQDTLKYQLTIWKNATHSKEKTQSIFPGEIIYDLEPETTYCLKVKAHMEDHISFYSPMDCIQTSKVWIGLPRLQNLQIHSLNMKHLLYWNNLYDGNVSFIVQLLPGYKAHNSLDISKEWENVSKCENIRTTFCDLSSVIGSYGIHYLRVQAVQSHNKSPWSKTLEFKPIEQINASKDSIHVFIASPGESENSPMSDTYELTYNVWYRTSSITVTFLLFQSKYTFESKPFTSNILKTYEIFDNFADFAVQLDHLEDDEEITGMPVTEMAKYSLYISST
uniref:Interferon/interleukin receptor domain-containing protein n=1 Tax=Laticauda laticaudata TaxID=8630 RepID=A0A8C5S4Q7_LATLA